MVAPPEAQRSPGPRTGKRDPEKTILKTNTEAAREIAKEVGARQDFAGWGEFGRIVVNVEAVYRNLDPAHRTPNVVEQFRRMAELESGHSPGVDVGG